MINKIIDGISNAICEEFGEEYEIYSEHMPQGFKEPCFFIMCLNPAEEQVVGSRYHRTHLFDVQYFPESKKNTYSELYEIQSRLIDCLEYINFENGIIRGTKRKSEIVDKVLHSFVNYNIHIRKEENFEYMGDLTLNQKIKR